MKELDHMFTFMPSWVQVVTFILLVCFGFGGFSKVITLFVTRKKTESEANLIEANAVAQKAVAKKVEYDHTENLLSRYEKDIISRDRKIEKLEKDSEVKNTAIQELQNEFYELRNQINRYQSKIDSLLSYIEKIKVEWVEITTRPFPQWDHSEDR